MCGRGGGGGLTTTILFEFPAKKNSKMVNGELYRNANLEPLIQEYISAFHIHTYMHPRVVVEVPHLKVLGRDVKTNYHCGLW